MKQVRENEGERHEGLPAWWGYGAAFGLGLSFVNEQRGQVCLCGGQGGLRRREGMEKLPWGVRTQTYQAKPHTTQTTLRRCEEWGEHLSERGKASSVGGGKLRFFFPLNPGYVYTTEP